MFVRPRFAMCVAHNARLTLWTNLSRALHNKSQPLASVREVDIPVPWGKVAGKLWGRQDKQPVLAMHGWQDNAASFDTLAPFLQKNTPVLAIDLPGHGLSSWLPPGFMYTEIVYLLLIKRIQRYFGWQKVKLLVHSLSAMTAYWYAGTFPEDVQYVIALDSYKFPSPGAHLYSVMFANAVEMLLNQEKSNSAQRRYTYDELIEKGIAGYATLSEMDETTYKVLMSRGSTRQEDGKYVINRDPRLRVLPIHSLFGQQDQETYARLIACPYLIIKGTDLYFGDTKENFYKVIEIMKSVNDNVHFETFPEKATHHFHLTHAEDAAAIINRFLEKYD